MHVFRDSHNPICILKDIVDMIGHVWRRGHAAIEQTSSIAHNTLLSERINDYLFFFYRRCY